MLLSSATASMVAVGRIPACSYFDNAPIMLIKTRSASRGLEQADILALRVVAKFKLTQEQCQWRSSTPA